MGGIRAPVCLSALAKKGFQHFRLSASGIFPVTNCSAKAARSPSRERSRVPVTMRLEIEEGGEKLTVTDADGNKAFAYGDFEPQPARTDPTESLRRSLAKTGGTPFEAADIAVEMDGGPWFVPGSTVNELRREALDALLKFLERKTKIPGMDIETRR